MSAVWEAPPTLPYPESEMLVGTPALRTHLGRGVVHVFRKLSPRWTYRATISHDSVALRLRRDDGYRAAALWTAGHFTAAYCWGNGEVKMSRLSAAGLKRLVADAETADDLAARSAANRDWARAMARKPRPGLTNRLETR